MTIRQKRYILKIGSWDGNDTGREQYSARGVLGAVYAVVSVAGSRAVIIDDGYRSPAEAKRAWPEALYEPARS